MLVKLFSYITLATALFNHQYGILIIEEVKLLPKLYLSLSTRAIQQYCHSSMSESNERVCQFVLDMIRCRDWYGSDE